MNAACDYCGLPVRAAGRDLPSQGTYCCYGCSLAAAISGSDKGEGASRGMMARLGLAIFFSMNVMVFTFFLWSQDAAPAGESATLLYDLARYICLLFTIPVIFLLAGPLVADAAGELARGRPSLSMLLVVGVAAAFLYSVDSVFRTGGHVYFEVSCSVLVAVTLGKWLEATGKWKTTSALRSLERLLPERVRKVCGPVEECIGRDEARVGDLLRVLPGERIPLDGVVCQTGALVDEQMVTGEPVPAHKSDGDQLHSGTMNLQSPLVMRATAAADAGFVARIVRSVTEAAAAKDRFTRLAESVALWFLPIVLAIAVATLAWHAAAGSWEAGMLAALSVVVIACPCALGLATPMAIWAAFGRAARRQVLVHHGDSFTQLARVRAIGFDKTGTLTTGQVRVVGVSLAPGATESLLLTTAAALASESTHPLSQAIADYATACGALAEGRRQVEQVRSIPGLGVIAWLKDARCRGLLGNERLMSDQEIRLPPTDAEAARDQDEGPLVWVARGGQLLGSIHFHEELRPESLAIASDLKKMEIEPVMLTGDRTSRALAIGRQTGMQVRGDLMPEDKQSILREFRKRFGCVAMVGDGINDAPALAAADVGIALGGGADISRDCAGICLLTNDLGRLPWLIDLSRQTVRTIRWNLTWALAYNVVGVGIAAGGWLHPAVAAVAMVASSLMVVSNSLRLANEPPAHESHPEATAVHQRQHLWQGASS